MEIINIKDLSFTYPNSEEKALNNVSLSINDGDFIVVCGESGCGKTTLLKLIKREIAPAGEIEGEILYMGKNISELDDRTAAGEIGYVMQNPEMQIVTDKVWHELAFGLENLGVPSGTIRRRVAEMASYFGIQNWFRRKTSDLSGGQKQLLNLAAIMVMQPKILILDEPTSQLDPIAASDFIATVKKLNRELALTVILVEHRLEEVFSMADKVAVMEKGSVIVYDEPAAVGEKLREVRQNSNMLLGLPSSIRIFNGLNINAKCPVTVKEGREFLSNNFKNTVNTISIDCKEFDGEPVVNLKNVWFRYERSLPDVLRGVELTAYKGEVLSILGGNGAGKTTMLRVLSGQNRAYRGDVLINGKKIAKYSQNELYHCNVAFLPQNPQEVFLKMSVREDFNEVAKAMGYTKDEKEKSILEITDRLGISHLLDKHPYDLSGGEQQKAALAKILLLKPKILLLDEPTKGIDAYSKHILGGILSDLKAQGMTVIMAVHDVEFAAEYSDRCALFFDGEIISEDMPNTFFSENNFYTTSASKISRHMYKNTVLCREVTELCKINEKK